LGKFFRDLGKDKKKLDEKDKPKLCSCGCGRPVGEGLHFLSQYCYHNKTNDEGSDGRRKSPSNGKGSAN